MMRQGVRVDARFAAMLDVDDAERAPGREGAPGSSRPALQAGLALEASAPAPQFGAGAPRTPAMLQQIVHNA